MTTLFLYFGSRMFHVSYGFFGKFTTPAQCRRGYEWYDDSQPPLFGKASLTIAQDSVHLLAIVLDRFLRPIHLVQDPSSERRP